MSSEDIQLQRQTERTYCFPEFDKVVNKVMERGGGVRLHHIVHNFYSQLNNYLEFVTLHQKQDWYTGVNINYIII